MTFEWMRRGSGRWRSLRAVLWVLALTLACAIAGILDVIRHEWAIAALLLLVAAYSAVKLGLIVDALSRRPTDEE